MKIWRRKKTRLLAIACLSVTVCAVLVSGPANPRPTASPQPDLAGLKPILDYISSAWDKLTRSVSECQSVVDPKVAQTSVLYLPAGFEEPTAVSKLKAGCNVKVEHLPVEIHRLGEITSNIDPPGLLYLPNKYVVPGGRFNEMYGWDSYFIVRGLLLAGRLELARGMVENFFFEIEHYGAVLNANRTYYLTRSQPPFLSSMVVDVYNASSRDKPDSEWLERAYTNLEKDYRMWTSEPHLAGDTGLSRYYDFGNGPPPEAMKDESGFYRKVATYFFFHPEWANEYVVDTDSAAAASVGGTEYSLQVCENSPGATAVCENPKKFKLSADYYKGDRSMRESGFDVSFRFKPFGSATHHYAPVCLNTLLYKNEKDLEQISRWLGREGDAAKWSKRAADRKKLITRYLWDPRDGMFFDYDFENKRLSTYRFATTFYPLWTGLATAEQAQAVDSNVRTFDRPGGLPMSTEDTGAQWDLPYGWGNIQMLAISGLRRYGYNADADRISYEFLSMVADNFRHDGNIREKYNVVTRSSEAHVELGYQMNVVGFGWTNAAFLELLHDLPLAKAERLAQEEKSRTGAGRAVRSAVGWPTVN